MCQTKYCRNKAPKGNKFCWTCISRKKRQRNPERYSYDALKANSKRRKKVFTITFEQFLHFCYATDYLTGKGKSKQSYTIDRIDNDKGYTFQNIQVLTKSANSKKLHYDWQTKYATVETYKKSDEWLF